MRKFSIILVAVLFGASLATAQSRTSLKGPAAKNYKPWKYEQKEAVIYTTDSENKTGPIVKNEKPWEKETDKAQLIPVVFLNPKKGLKGPVAKNYKPWTLQNIDSIRVPSKPLKPAGKVITKD
jgi:hypothetical protein